MVDTNGLALSPYFETEVTTDLNLQDVVLLTGDYCKQCSKTFILKVIRLKQSHNVHLKPQIYDT